MTSQSETQTNSDVSRTPHNVPKHPDVEISVRNFGPITAADLDLRPLTVFVGPSNTGKTYLATLIYALHGNFAGFSEFPLMNYVTTPLGTRVLRSGFSVNDESFMAELQETHEKLNRQGAAFRFSDLPKTVRDAAQEMFKNSEHFSTELKRCFDLDSVSELIQLGRGEGNEMTVSLKVSAENQALWHFNMRCSKSAVTADGGINEEMVLPHEEIERLKETFTHEDLLELFLGESKITRRRYYLPAARSNIMRRYRVIASSLVTRSTRAGLDSDSELPTFSGVIADFMQQIILYEEPEKSGDGLNHIADALESNVLAGQIITKPSSTGYPEFLYRPNKTEEEIRLTRSASMVSELAPLALFIRGLIRPGDTLIIEEPESHLHPAAQAKMAAPLACLVRAGVRVLVTTHSDWLLKEIANLMHEGELKKKGALRKETEKLARWLLPEEVGAWLFQKNGQVEEIKFDRINGIEPMEYEDLAEALYNRWAGLQNRLEGTKSDN